MTQTRQQPEAIGAEEHVSLVETLDRVLHKGAVISGDAVISVGNVDLIYISLRLLLASVETAMAEQFYDEQGLGRPTGGQR